MNGKQAKRLRRAAMGMAVHLVEQGKTIKTSTEHSKPQRDEKIDPLSSDLPPPPKRSETEVNRPDTLRGIYRYLKKSNDPQK